MALRFNSLLIDEGINPAEVRIAERPKRSFQVPRRSRPPALIQTRATPLRPCTDNTFRPRVHPGAGC